MNIKSTTLESYKARILKNLVYIQQNLDNELSLEILAEMASFSTYHFHRIFSGMVGESLQGHIRRLRLERSAKHLKHTNRPVIDIAFEAGYKAHESFTHAFKTNFGIAPSIFRSKKSLNETIKTSSGVHYQENGALNSFDYNDSTDNNVDVTIKKKELIRVAFMRHVGPYSECGKTWGKLLSEMGRNGYINEKSLIIAICHDDPEITKPERIRYDACVSVDEKFTPSGEIGSQIISSGEYAVITHCGAYHQKSATYDDFFSQWLPQSGRELSDYPPFEIFLNDPSYTEPEDLKTDIYIPLKTN